MLSLCSTNILLQKYRNHNFMTEYNFETNFHSFGKFSDSYYSIEKVFTQIPICPKSRFVQMTSKARVLMQLKDQSMNFRIKIFSQKLRKITCFLRYKPHLHTQLIFTCPSISNMFLAQYRRLDTSSRPFHDFIKIAI